MLEPTPEEHPSARAELEIRGGALLPSVAARTTVPGPDAKFLLRLISFFVTVVLTLATLAGASWLALPIVLVLVVAGAVAVLGVLVTMRE